MRASPTFEGGGALLLMVRRTPPAHADALACPAAWLSFGSSPAAHVLLEALEQEQLVASTQDIPAASQGRSAAL